MQNKEKESRELLRGNEGESSVEQKKTQSKKAFPKWIWAVAGVLVILFTGRIIMDAVVKNDDAVICIYSDEEDKTMIYVNNKAVGTLDGMAFMKSNMNRSVNYIQAEDAVYILDKKELVKVMEHARVVAVANKSVEALILSETDGLYWYNGKEAELVTKEEITYATISGDGKNYAYMIEANSYFGKEAGETTKAENVAIFALSEDGELRYGFRCHESDLEVLALDENMLVEAECIGTELLLVQDDGECIPIAEEGAEIVGFNRNGTELVYNIQGSSYISVDGKEGKKIFDHSINSFYFKVDKEDWNDSFWPVDTFVKNYFVAYADGDFSSHVFCFLTDDYEAEICMEGTYYVGGKDGKNSKILYQTEEGDLYWAKVSHDMSGELVAEDVTEFTISENGKIICYSVLVEEVEGGEIYEIYCVKGDSKPTCVGRVKNLRYFDLCENDVYIVTNDACYYVDGEELMELEGIDDLTMDYVTMQMYGYGEELYQISGKNRKRLLESFDYIDYCFAR